VIAQCSCLADETDPLEKRVEYSNGIVRNDKEIFVDNCYIIHHISNMIVIGLLVVKR
jgi:hypothetical protein